MSSKTSKFVTKQLVQKIITPSGKEYIGKIIAPRGNNLHEVETEFGESFLVSMPTRFRKTLWVRRGSYVILQPIEEGDKVRAEIIHVLDMENIEFLLEKGDWPKRFLDEAELLTKRTLKVKDADSDLYPSSSDSSSENASDEEKETEDME